MKRCIFVVLLLVLSAHGSLWAQGGGSRGAGAGRSGAGQAQTLQELLETVKTQEDDVDRRVFGRITALGTEASLRGLCSAINSLRSEYVLGAAYLAFTQYKGKESLESKSIKFLHLHAQKHKRAGNQRAAARALTRFGPPAHGELESIFRSKASRQEDVASIVFAPLIPVFGQRGEAKDASTIIEHADIRSTTQEATVRKALLGCSSDACTKVLCKHLSSKNTPLRWKVLLLDLVGQRQGSHVDRAILRALLEDAAPVRTQAIQILGNSGKAENIPALERHLDADDPGELRAAVVALSQLNSGNRQWTKSLIRMARSNVPGERMGAAVGLLQVRTQDAIECLEGLVLDTDWRVRIEAIEQLASLRRPQTVGLLISRLQFESGRMRHDICGILRLMTGEDHGTRHTRWSHWWADRGEDYKLPPYEVALEAEVARAAHKQDSSTAVTFYGLRVVSERLAFVVDISGSMAAGATWHDDRSHSGKGKRTTRLAVAKKELQRALEGLPAGVLFNLVFFSSGVGAWQDELLAMDDKILAEALQYVQRQGAGGGTNIYDALMAVYDDPQVDTLYLLSDGEPSAGAITSTAKIHDEVMRLNQTRKLRIHCIAIGESSQFMRGLAEGTGGSYVEFL